MGNAQTGALTLSSPLGTSIANLEWTPTSAILLANGQTRHFDSLHTLVAHATGTDIPVAALFSWLIGEDPAVAGWQADLSQRTQGRIRARRTFPTPPVELRLVLED